MSVADVQWKEEHGGGPTWAWGTFKVVPKNLRKQRSFELEACIGFRAAGEVISAWWMEGLSWKKSECFQTEPDAYPWLMELACHATRLWQENLKTRDPKCGWCAQCHKRLPGCARADGVPILCFACGG